MSYPAYGGAPAGQPVAVGQPVQFGQATSGTNSFEASCYKCGSVTSVSGTGVVDFNCPSCGTHNQASAPTTAVTASAIPNHAVPYTGSPGPTTIVVDPATANAALEGMEREVHYLYVYSRGRTVKIFSVIDFVFAIIAIFLGNLISIAGLVFAPIGYYGARRYKKPAVIVYLVYLILEFIVTAILVFGGVLNFVLGLISLMLQILIIGWVAKFIQLLPCEGIEAWTDAYHAQGGGNAIC